MCDRWTDIQSTVLYLLWDIRTFLQDCVTPRTICAPVWLYFIEKVLKVREYTKTCDGLMNCSVCVNKKGAKLHYSLEKHSVHHINQTCIATVRWKHPTLVNFIPLLEKLGPHIWSVTVCGNVFPWGLFCSCCIFFKCMVISLKIGLLLEKPDLQTLEALWN